MAKDQKPLEKVPDPENPGKFIAEEVHVYDGPRGKGEITFRYRINGDKVQVKAEHVGPETDRPLPLDWTDVSEAPLQSSEKKTRSVKKTVIQRDAQNKAYEVVKEDFQEVYYEPVLVPNPSPARAVIEKDKVKDK